MNELHIVFVLLLIALAENQAMSISLATSLPIRPIASMRQCQPEKPFL